LAERLWGNYRLTLEKGESSGTQNLALNAIVFLYKLVLN